MIKSPPQGSISPADIINSMLKSYYRGKIISLLSDSLTTYTGYVPVANRCRYPQNDLLITVQDTWWKRLIDDLGLTLGINESWAGSYVSWDGSTESTDIGADKHIASTARIQNLGDNGTPDIIVIWAGTNDVTNAVTVGTFDTTSPIYTAEQLLTLPVDTFANAYRTMLIRLISWYPYAKIVVMFPTYSGSYTSANLDIYDEIVRTACDFYGVTYIDVRDIGINMLNRTEYLPDGTHFNALGMKMLYEHVVKAFISSVNLFQTLDYGGDTTGLTTYYAASTVNLKTTDNLYTYLKEKTYYYNNTQAWVDGSGDTVTSVNFKVNPGDHIIADSFQVYPDNGYGGSPTNGIRVTYLLNGTVVSQLAPAATYAEYDANGFLTVPANVNEICVPLWAGARSGKHWVYNQSL